MSSVPSALCTSLSFLGPPVFCVFEKGNRSRISCCPSHVATDCRRSPIEIGDVAREHHPKPVVNVHMLVVRRTTTKFKLWVCRWKSEAFSKSVFARNQNIEPITQRAGTRCLTGGNVASRAQECSIHTPLECSNLNRTYRGKVTTVSCQPSLFVTVAWILRTFSAGHSFSSFSDI